jgi:3-oxoacyl-[acyl-carrier protein] reductase
MNHVLLTPLETVNKVMGTNVVGTFLFSREAAKLMKKNKYGRIVNFSTVAVPLDLEGECIYAASKAAVVSITRVMARELAELGITVNAVGPTPAETDLIRNVPSNKLKELTDRQAISRFAEIEEVKNIIDFFIKPESAFVTGQTVYLGGV